MTLILTEYTERDEDCTEARVKNMEDLLDVPFTLGIPLQGRLPPLWLTVTSEPPPADYFTSGGMHLVSQKLADILQEEVPAPHFELLPVHVEHAGAPYEQSRYYFLNIMHRVDALDRQRSVYTLDDDWVDSISSLVLDETVASRQALFVLDRSYVQLVCVREDVAEGIRLAGCTGCHFISPREWRW